MKLFLFGLLFLGVSLDGASMPLLPLQLAEAEHVDFDEKVIHLVGHVKVVHEFGTLCCDEGTLLLPQEKKDEDHEAVDTILLNGNVSITFTDGSTLVANEGIIDCQKLEGTFLADPPEKVTYCGFATDNHRKVPVRATGRALKANITKTDLGYSLTSLRGEGAVNIEYLYSNPQESDNKSVVAIDAAAPQEIEDAPTSGETP